MTFYILDIFIKNYFSKDQSLIKEKDEYKSKGCDEFNFEIDKKMKLLMI